MESGPIKRTLTTAGTRSAAAHSWSGSWGAVCVQAPQFQVMCAVRVLACLWHLATTVSCSALYMNSACKTNLIISSTLFWTSPLWPLYFKTPQSWCATGAAADVCLGAAEFLQKVSQEGICRHSIQRTYILRAAASHAALADQHARRPGRTHS